MLNFIDYIKAWVEAMENKNPELLESILHDEFQWTSHHKSSLPMQVRSKKETIAWCLETKAKFLDTKPLYTNDDVFVFVQDIIPPEEKNSKFVTMDLVKIKNDKILSHNHVRGIHPES